MASHTCARGAVGVYVHIPFCAHRCDYCAFATWTDKDHLVSSYIDACIKEIDRHRREATLGAIATVFIGGGTPSLIGAFELCRLLDAIGISAGTEVTVECNPESTTPALLCELRRAGVNRISLGVQSLHEHVLLGLGRKAEPSKAQRVVSDIGDAGFTSFNVDLIYGGAGETNADLASTLAGVLDFSPTPPHVSAYALSVEKNTPLSRDPARHPDDDVLASRYALVDEVLTDAGYAWYEVSNWAVSGHECRHNLDCWDQRDYLGIGASAHSHLGGTRSINWRSPERYIEAVEKGLSPVAASEVLDDDERAFEALFLSLRTKNGVPEAALGDDGDLEGLVVRHDGRAVLTRAGRLLMNEVALRLRPTKSHGA